MNEKPTSDDGVEQSGAKPIELDCPHCHCAVSIAPREDAENEISCPSCGNAFQLDLSLTTDWSPVKLLELGKFTLHDIVGQGAFGTVYRAHDNELDRIVAIKVPRSGAFQSQEEEDRFVREARNTAQLKHAGIVSVFEVGRDEKFPYIVSEFVQGNTLADVLTAKHFSARHAAALMSEIAAALSHAHQQGVVHRDIKPSNIMLERCELGSDSSVDASGSTVDKASTVTRRADAPDSGYRPRLMDFGLARRDEGEITMTIEGQVLGTPAYMSPEQAQGEGHQADARSDIYSLGVIFFELLTGERPFRGNKRMLLDQVIHDDPPSPRRLNASVPADLETVCLRCLQKSPSRRFASAEEFRHELLRFLRGEPIQSRPISSVERAWRWSVKHRAIALSTTAIAAVVVGALVLVTMSRTKERHARLLTERVLAAQSDFLRSMADVSEELGMTSVGVEVKRLEISRKICKSWDDYVAELPRDFDAQSERGAAYGRLAVLYREVGEPREAEGAFMKAHQILVALDNGENTKPAYLEHLGTTLLNFGVLKKSQGNIADAEASYREAIVVYRRLLTRFPDRQLEYEGTLAGLHLNLGNLISDIPRYDDAEMEYARSLEMFERLAAKGTDPGQLGNVASVKNSLAILYRQTGQLERAKRLYGEALAARRKLVEMEPTSSERRNQLAATLHNLAIFHLKLGRHKQAEELLVEGRDIRLQLVDEHPNAPRFQNGVDNINRNLAIVYANTNRSDEAAELHEQTIARYKNLIESYPGVTDFQYSLAMQYRSIANLRHELGQLDLCLEATRDASSIFEQLFAKSPDATRYRDGLAETRLNAVMLLRDLGQASEAMDASRDLLETLQQLSDTAPTPAGQLHLAFTHQFLGDLQREQGHLEQSLPSYDRAVAVLTDLVAKDGGNRQAGAQLVECIEQRIDAYRELGKTGPAMADWQRLLDLGDETQRDEIRLRRAIFMARIGQHARAADEAGELAATSAKSPALHYNLACVYARAAVGVGLDASLEAGAAGKLTEQYQGEAMAALKTAFAAGFSDLDGMLADPDLESLRERPDFKQLIADSRAAK